MKVIVQLWEESERGWGIRPDGYSIHPDKAALDRYLKNYWNRMPADAPAEYSRERGDPYQADVDADFNGQDGIRMFDNKYPSSLD